MLTKQQVVEQAKKVGMLCATCGKLSKKWEADVSKDVGGRVRYPARVRCTCKSVKPVASVTPAVVVKK